MLSEGTSSEGMVSPIEQKGNYFIMDSEQIVCNPYQELQTEALDSAKKSSNTERLTSVRNNVCEHHLRTETGHLEKQRTHSLRNLHMDTSNLRYQVKVMDINKRKNDLAMQQRMLPRKDFSYDHHQITISAKRLGVTSEESFYLNKKLQFPLRGNITRDHNAKPFIKKAQRAMANHAFNKKVEQRSQTAHTFDRAPTAQTMSTSVEIMSPEPPSIKMYDRSTRRGSKSAPPNAKPSVSEPKMSRSRLNTVVDVPDGAKLPDIMTQSVGATAHQNKSHVKFLVEEPGPLRQSTPNRLHRSKTYYSGMTRKPRSYSEAWDSDSDDDNYTYTEKVDLRALFFGDKTQSVDNKSAINGSTTPRTFLTNMSGELPLFQKPPSQKPPSEEQMIKESIELKTKIDSFLGHAPKQQKLVEKKEEKKEEKLEKKQLDSEKGKMEDSAKKASYILGVFSKPIDKDKIWGGQTKKDSEELEKKKKVEVVKIIEKPKSAESERPTKRNLWEMISVNMKNGTLDKNYSANDLLLQQLTGILVQSDKNPPIPLHSASRALRHTPTFKMRRVVEELTRQRTRYEQQEVEKLQQLEMGEGGQIMQDEDSGVQHYPSRAWASPTKQLEQES